MTSKHSMSRRVKSGLALTALLFASTSALADTVNVSVDATTAVLSDGQSVPMWSYHCGDVVVGSAATCAHLNPTAGSNWTPIVITVPFGADLTIHLSNNLSFGGEAKQKIPTSIVIVGQLGGGLGLAPVRMLDKAQHPAQGTTWPGTLGDPGDTAFTPPAQSPRVRSFGTEVAANSAGDLCWGHGCASGVELRPGTYLIQSGTQPSIQGPMGLVGVLVVTNGSYPSTSGPAPFDHEVTMLLNEIDPVQNAAVAQAVSTLGFDDTKTWSGQTGECGDPGVHTCYPPAVNYQPLYYLINGVSFDRSNFAASTQSLTNPAAQGNVLLRFVNAGLRMHVPSVVNSTMTIRAEDGNTLPGEPRKQSSLFMAAGKTFDVTISPRKLTSTSDDCAALPCYAANTYAVFDRALGLSTNNQRDGGMQAYIKIGAGSVVGTSAAIARGDKYDVVAGKVTVTDPAKGLIKNDSGIYGVTLKTGPVAGLALNANGTFTYSGAPTSFAYCGNNVTAGTDDDGTPPDGDDACTTVTLVACADDPGCMSSEPVVANPDSYSSKVASQLLVSAPGVLENDSDPSHLKLKAVLAHVATDSCGVNGVQLNEDGSFNVTPAAPGVPCAFSYKAVNSQGTESTVTTVNVNFPVGSGLVVHVKDGKTGDEISDYRWVIEEDRSIYIDPTIESAPGTAVRNVAVNFHAAYLPMVAQGCVGDISCEIGQTVLGVAAACDQGNGVCTTDRARKSDVRPSDVVLDPTKRYYISILPGDGGNPVSEFPDGVNFVGTPEEGHTMSGTQIAAGQLNVNVYVQKTPLEPAKIAVFIFEDDSPLNGEVDTGGGVDVLAPNEAGLGGFNIVLLDQVGGMGDAAGQLTYDMFGQPVSNSLAGMIDPATGRDACPISPSAANRSDGTQNIVGMIVTCPKFEGGTYAPGQDRVLSPLAGHAVIANMYPGLYEVVASPAADRIAKGEEWLQTNTLDGTKAIEAFIKAGEPAYFQEFGPGGFHVAVGFANPKIINDRKASVCQGQTCTSTINGIVTATRMSRAPDERVYSSESYTAYGFGNCYVSLGTADGDDFAFTKCDENGKFQFTGLPKGNFKVTVFDQWNDLLVDGLSTPVNVDAAMIGTPDHPLDISVTQWRTNLYGRVFIDTSGDGVSQDDEPGLPLAPYNIRYRDGSYAGFNNTDLAGFAGFNEVFPFLNWLVIDTDSARYKQTGVHVVYDTGGPVDGTAGGGASGIAEGYANTIESSSAHLPNELRVPDAIYCVDADCSGTKGHDIDNPSSGRVDPGWVPSEGWQGLLGQSSFIEFAMKPFAPGENGGIKGHVLYTPTRPFDDPALLLQLSWAPGIPNVKVNLYRKGVAADGVSETLELVDTTMSASWDDWAQGFRRDANGNPVMATDNSGAVANMNCPGQETDSPFYFTMVGGTQPLNPDQANHMAEDGRFRCYDGWSMLNQVQPAPYNGLYRFPSVVGKVSADKALPPDGNWVVEFDPKAHKTNCSICKPNLAVPPTDPDYLKPMLPAGKYVVEVVIPQGYELVKEEDKNILLGDAFNGPVTQQVAGGFGNIFIMPDQAAVGAAYNPTNPIQSTSNNGAVPRHEGDTGSVEVFWPCVGAERIVPDFNSLYPFAQQASAFAGAKRPLCDRKEVQLNEQMTALVKFYLFSSAHVAAKFTGLITNDFASEFDPFSPQFGEKFGVPNVPVALRDFTGKEISRVYADQWGAYNGASFTTYTVNPPSPSGYIPQMMTACMNDPGPIDDPAHPGQQITDPAYNPAYSDFCYEIPFMPGQTAYLDTPVIPTMAHAAGYNLPDCEYADYTPAILKVVGDVADVPGPWVPNSSSGVSSVTVVTGGSNYASLPNISFTGGGGSGAAASPTMKVSGLSFPALGGLVGITPGNYSGGPPSVAFTGGGGSGAAATPFLGVGAVSIVGNGGQGSYTSTLPTVTVTISQPTTCIVNGTTCVQATGNVVLFGFTNATRRVLAVTITNPGRGYTTAPTLTFSRGTAAATATLGVGGADITNGGSGYTSQPTATFTCISPCSSTTPANAYVTMSVNAVTVTNPGAGYSTAPSVAFSGGGPLGGLGVTQATATAAISGGGGGGHTLMISSLGDRKVLNHAYSGPMATTAPYNQKTITRHYGFGSCDSVITNVANPLRGSCTNGAKVTIGGVIAPLSAAADWTDSEIKVSVPSGVPACAMQQVGGPNAMCGELEITAANGKKSIDAVTVTVGGKKPVYLTPDSPSVSTFGHIQPNPIQHAIDIAAPGDLILVGPGTYRENLLMWKPVRLQGVGAESVFINADAHPAGKLDSWRRQVDCLFGMALNGQPITGGNPYDKDAVYSCPTAMRQHVDRIPFEAILGWDTTGNGNLAQMLQEPTLMGAYEGAGVTVLGKGVWMPANTTLADQFGGGTGGGFPVDYRYLNASTSPSNANPGDCRVPSGNFNPVFWREYYSTNFLCNPSRIDGISVINSSQGGGAIFAHGWNHNMEVANTRVHGNHGTLTGGITIGNGEFPDAIINLDPNDPDFVPVPFPVPNNTPTGLQLGYGFNRFVKVHHNAITSNASIGDALYSGTPSGAGGVSFCSGADNYSLSNNWICGNLSTGDAGGVSHSGFINDGVIANNQILFNQSQNATLSTNGGGIGVLGASPDRTITTGPNAGQECGSTTDADCPPGLPEGTGRNLRIDANLIMGNSAESGSGGGIRLQMVNGLDAVAFPTRSQFWNDVTVTNNIIANNIAGWDGGGISLQDAMKVKIINNTLVQNDTTASAGVLFNTLGAPFAATPPPGCTPSSGPDATCPHIPTSTNQAAGLVTMRNTPNMVAELTGTVSCPTGYGYDSAPNIGACKSVSLPLLLNNVFWQNRAFHIEVGPLGDGTQGQQKVVTLVPTLDQSFTGQIITQGTEIGAQGSGEPAHFWDIGVRGDTGPTNHGSGFVLTPRFSILSATGTDYAGNNNQIGADPAVQRQYSNGARIAPEGCNGVAAIDQPRCKGYHAPVGQSEFTGLPVVFAINQLTVAATVDEGNNWIDLGYGPLSGVSPIDGHTVLGNFRPSAGSPAIDAIASGSAGFTAAPATDFYGSARKVSNNAVDVGAVEFAPTNGAAASVSPSGLDFGPVLHGTSSAAKALTVHNNGNAPVTGITVAVATPFSRPAGAAGGTCDTATPVAEGGTCTINIVYAAPNSPDAAHPLPIVSDALVTITANVPVTGSPVTVHGTSVSPPVVGVTFASGQTGAFGEQVIGGTPAIRTLILKNTGGSSFTGITVNVTGAAFSRSGGVCSTTLGAGASCTIDIAFAPTVIAPVTGGVTITGSNATVTGLSMPIPLSGSGRFEADLSVTKTDGVNSIQSSRPTTYTIVVTNNGPSAVTGATVSDTRPAGMAAWSWRCTANTTLCGGSTLPQSSALLSRTLGTLQAGQSVTFTATGTVTAATGNLVNTATVTKPAAITDPTSTNNTATDTDSILPAPGTVAFASASPIPLTTVFGQRVLNFGNVGDNTTSVVTLSVGTAAVTFGTASVNNTINNRFSISADTCSGNTVASGGTCTITVKFNGGAGTNFSLGQLSVPSNGLVSPANLNLTGS